MLIYVKLKKFLAKNWPRQHRLPAGAGFIAEIIALAGGRRSMGTAIP